MSTFRALWASPNRQGKSFDQVKKIFEGFLDSGSEKLCVEFVTPETLELKAIIVDLVGVLKEVKNLGDIFEANSSQGKCDAVLTHHKETLEKLGVK